SVSADGSVIVGTSSSSSGSQAFIWDEADGMRSLQTVLASQGLGAALQGWTLTSAIAISSNGLTITGDGYDPQGHQAAWIATLTPGFVVTTLADSGPRSLRDVITRVNSDPIANGTDTITFANNLSRGTIALESPLPALTRSQVTIN